MKRVMLDTNEYDKLVIHPEFYHKLLWLLTEGKVELLSTHIQRDEIIAINDAAKKEKKVRLEQLLSHTRMIETRGLALGVSKLDLARFGANGNHEIIRQVRDIKDGLIASTASGDADILVTEDKDFTRRLEKCSDNKCEVINFAEFETRITSECL